MYELEHFNICVSILQLNLWQKFRCNRDQPLLRPFLEPIYAGAVDQTGEHSQSNSEGLTNRTKADDQFELILDSLQEKLENSIKSQLSTYLFYCFFSYGLTNLYSLFRKEKVGDRANVQDIVDVLEKLFIFDLSVTEEKRYEFVFNAYLCEYFLHVFPELNHAIVFGNLQAHGIVICDERCKLSKGFPSTSSQTDQQSTASRLSYNS